MEEAEYLPDFDTVLNEIEVKFFAFLPPDELRAPRIFNHIEWAHWYYSDFYVHYHPNVYNKYKLRPFVSLMMERPFLQQFFGSMNLSPDRLFADTYYDYMHSIRRFGCILVNKEESHVLMVTPWGGKNKGWSFPRGKVDQSESPLSCAIRETKEEVGFDVTPLLPPTPSLLPMVLGGFFVIGNVDDERVQFQTETRFEIGEIEWRAFTNLSKEEKKGVKRGLKRYHQLFHKSQHHHKNKHQGGGGGGQRNQNSSHLRRDGGDGKCEYEELPSFHYSSPLLSKIQKRKLKNDFEEVDELEDEEFEDDDEFVDLCRPS